MVSSTRNALLVGGLLSLVACPSGPSADSSETTGESGSDASMSSPTSGPTSETESSAPTSAGMGSADGASSTGDGITGTPCEFFPSDCPDGYNCLPVGEGGETICVPVVDEPEGPHEPCEALDGQTDTCEVGSWCILPDSEGAGVCSPLCPLSFGNGACGAAALCLELSEAQDLGVCARGCDPLAQDCAGDATCRAITMGFYCLPASDETMPTGAPCQPGDCAPGDICTSGKVLDGCTDEMCCARLCDENDPLACTDSPNGNTCFDLLEDGQPLPEWDVVGVCVFA